MATTLGVKLDADTRARLRRLAEVKERSPHWLMKAAIKAYLDAEERYEREKAEDLARWDRYVTTGVAVSSAEMDVFFDELLVRSRQAAGDQPR